MPEYIRALLVVLVIASATFSFVRTNVTTNVISINNFVRRRNAWFLITFAGFLSQNYWIFLILIVIIVTIASKQETNKIALFFFLVFTLPQIRVDIPGFADIRYIYSIDFVRILTLLILFPVCLSHQKNANYVKYNAFTVDKILAIYIIFNLVLQMRYDILTNIIRSAIDWFVDVVIPYYAISRSIRNLKEFRDVLTSFLISVLIISVIGSFEFFKHWILYSSMGDALGVMWNPGYLLRGELLRASATSGHSLVLAFIIAVAAGLSLYLKDVFENRIFRMTVLLILAFGIIAPVSRGAWVGLATMVLIFVIIGNNAIKKMIGIFFVLSIIYVFIITTNIGLKAIEYLPFIGTVDNFNVTYRQLLFDKAFQIIINNPIFGSTNYIGQMEDLRQGQGIIDLVNTFLIVGLNSGLVGLFLFVAFFTIICIRVFIKFKKFAIGSQIYNLGRSLFAVMIGILLIIATVSPIYHIPLILWSFGAMCLAYSNIDFETSYIKPSTN